MRRAPDPLGRRGGARELGAAVEGDPDAGPHRPLEQRVALHRPVERDPVGVGAGAHRRLELALAEGVAAGSLLGQDPPQRQRLVRLDRRQEQERTAPARAELRLEAPGVAAQLVLRDDVERRAEALGQVPGAAFLDVEPVGARREGLVDRLGGGARGHATGAPSASAASAAARRPVSGAN